MTGHKYDSSNFLYIATDHVWDHTLKTLLSPVKRGDIGFSFSVCPSVRVRVQAKSPKVVNGKFLNFTYG